MRCPPRTAARPGPSAASPSDSWYSSLASLLHLQRGGAFHPVPAAVLDHFFEVDPVIVDRRNHAEVLAHVVALLDPEEVGARPHQGKYILVLLERADHRD